MFSCINLLQTDFEREREWDCNAYLLQNGVLKIYKNNVWQTISFILGSKGRPCYVNVPLVSDSSEEEIAHK